jgi:DNA-binding NarL/FixJ family response regulator
MNILLWCDDLMSRTRIASALQAAGATVLKKTATETPDCVIVDLTSRDAAGHVARLRAAHPAVEIIAFGPHVDEAGLAAAKAAGANEAVPRGAILTLMQRRLQRT